MKRKEIHLAVLAAVVLFLAACNGGSSDDVAATPEPVTPTAPAAEPTPTPEPIEVSERDRILAAANALNESIAAGVEAPGDFIVVDVIDSAVADDGVVTLTLCGWDGETVFDELREAVYRTEVSDDGSVTATETSTQRMSGDCLNITLINSAIETINEYENYWTDITRNPATFADDPRGAELLTERHLDVSKEATDKWVADDVYFDHNSIDGQLPDSAIAEVLWRHEDFDGEPSFEVAFCRTMDPDFGIYRDGVRISDEKPVSDVGLHAIDSYVLRRDEAESWRIESRDGLIWADCFGGEDWPTSATIWRTGEPFQAVAG